jgi:hypothetical protein
MMRIFGPFYRLISSRALTPVVIGVFLMLYVGIAFFTEEALITLINLAKSSMVLITLFALIPINRVLRLFEEIKAFRLRLRILRGADEDIAPGLYDETVEMTESASFTDVERRLATAGYKTRVGERSLAAWRGVSIFPARALFSVVVILLFSGILISLAGRKSFRGAIIEGEPLYLPAGPVGVVEQISLQPSAGPLLSKVLTIKENSGNDSTVFGLYPPASYDGVFVYPRYLGIAVFYRFSAPDVPDGREVHTYLSIYPPGKEDGKEIPNSPYRLLFSLVQPENGSDPYMTGRITINFKLLKGNEQLMNGSAPMGAEIDRNGYRLAFPDMRRLVITDFIQDYGVELIWCSGILLCFAVCFWLPVRCLMSRREILLIAANGGIRAFSLDEGGGRKHARVFHDILDTFVPRNINC